MKFLKRYIDEKKRCNEFSINEKAIVKKLSYKDRIEYFLLSNLYQNHEQMSFLNKCLILSFGFSFVAWQGTNSLNVALHVLLFFLLLSIVTFENFKQKTKSEYVDRMQEFLEVRR